MVLHTLSGAMGVGIVVIAYVPQIARIVRTRRAAGVSIPTYLLWAAGSALLLVHAMGMGSAVFTVLTIFQIVACLVIIALTLSFREPRQGKWP
jgi:MtN3 and saliva related transmembrane protein